MKTKQIHKAIGILLTVPLIAWALTGMVFLTKPGYDRAYEELVIKTYPLQESFNLGSAGRWHEARLIKTVLGYHLLLEDGGRKAHLNPANLEPFAVPSDVDSRRLINDAISISPDRYGEIVRYSNGVANTSTGVQITLNWPDLTLVQSGKDTRLINNLYKIHYLQWSGFSRLDTVLGLAGIVLLLVLTALGLSGVMGSGRK